MQNDSQNKKPWFRPKRYGYGWTPASWQGWAITLSSVLIVAVSAFWIKGLGRASQPASYSSPQASQQPSSTPTLLINGETIHLEVADTPALREQGLSGHAPLGMSSGMLFVFPTPSDTGFWMKDMLFALDMIWLDADYRVITIKKDATPESFPSVFFPAAPASYVLELPAGFAGSHGISVGSTLSVTR